MIVLFSLSPLGDLQDRCRRIGQRRGGDLSAGPMTEVWGPHLVVRPHLFCVHHTLVHKALNPGGLGAGPQNRKLDTGSRC
jgi:hypothetical protein